MIVVADPIQSNITDLEKVIRQKTHHLGMLARCHRVCEAGGLRKNTPEKWKIFKLFTSWASRKKLKIEYFKS